MRTRLLLVGAMLGIASMAHALPSTWYADTQTTWEGWTTSQMWNGQLVSNMDVIGGPDIFSWGFSTQGTGLNRTLTEVAFRYDRGNLGSTSPSWNIMEPGDLFIDFQEYNNIPLGKYQWDYVVAPDRVNSGPLTYNTTVYSLGTPALPAPKADYQAAQPTTYQYDIVQNGAPPWQGYVVRDDHPWKLKNTPAQGISITDGFSWTRSSLPQNEAGVNGNQDFSYMIFSGLNLAIPDDPLQQIPLYETIAVGFTVNCANDVIYEDQTIPSGGEIPEPGTLILLGSGLIGLVGLRRRQA